MDQENATQSTVVDQMLVGPDVSMVDATIKSDVLFVAGQIAAAYGVVLTIEEVATLRKISKTKVYEAAASGDLIGSRMKDRGAFRFLAVRVAQWIVDGEKYSAQTICEEGESEEESEAQLRPNLLTVQGGRIKKN